MSVPLALVAPRRRQRTLNVTMSQTGSPQCPCATGATTMPPCRLERLLRVYDHAAKDNRRFCTLGWQAQAPTRLNGGGGRARGREGSPSGLVGGSGSHSYARRSGNTKTAHDIMRMSRGGLIRLHRPLMRASPRHARRSRARRGPGASSINEAATVTRALRGACRWVRRGLRPARIGHRLSVHRGVQWIACRRGVEA